MYSPSVSGENQGLEGKDERLQPQDERMHQRDRVDDVQEQPPPGADVRIDKSIVVVGVGVRDAQAPRWDIREPALVERLEKDSQRARPGRLLRIDQNVGRLDLAGGEGVLLIGYGAMVISLVDNFLRPFLVGKDTKMPDYLVLISTLGGIAAFGLNGFVIGPVIAAMFIAVWEIFSASRQAMKDSTSE
jgi:hypothetical protein